MATHIVGGEVSYKYIATVAGGNQYEISMSIYEDCLNGTPSAILADNLAFFAIYNGAGQLFRFDSVEYNSVISVPANFSNACITNVPSLCLLKKTFVYSIVLPPDSTGYTFEYQRCCRNASIVNIHDPANIGATYYCNIPASTVTPHNNSAVFNNFPPQIICVNNPLVYDNSATDPDGDSLSYELCSAYDCLNGIPDNAVPPPAPWNTVNYIYPPYSFSYPMTAYPDMAIDPHTGILSGTPNRIGRYLVTVCCLEWRNGVLINTVQREFQFVVTDCSKVVVANIPVLTSIPNTYVLDCTDYTIHFINTSTGGSTWKWDFGVPGAPLDSSFEPTFTYPDTGTFTVKLVVNPGGTCADSITRQVEVYPKFKAAFSYGGNQCANAAISFADQSIATIKPVTSWLWYFGDGDSSTAQAPSHNYKLSGTYTIFFVAENVKDCIDTAIGHVVIDNFKPFAGNDTVIVKGETILFDANGGIQYTWTPGTDLNNTNTYNPTGYYADTGLYVYDVHVQSAYGCTGDDTIKVKVVNQAEFFVPLAFSPNGDGKNDLFRPVAVGYRSMKYFKVFNRWGETVYYGTSLDTGWDGTYKGQRAELGTYFWEMSFIDRFGKTDFMKGDVTLLR